MNNDDTVQPGKGFLLHRHRDMEIVTWVLEGELEHEDTVRAQGQTYQIALRLHRGERLFEETS